MENKKQSVLSTGVNRIAQIGFVVALAGLLLFWLPGVGLGLCFLGAMLSLIGLFRKPYAYAFFGVIVSVVNLAFMVLLAGNLVLNEKGPALPVEKDFVKDEPSVLPASPENDVEDDLFAEETSSSKFDDLTPARPVSPSGEDVSSSERISPSPRYSPTGTRTTAEDFIGEPKNAPLPISAFEEISKYRFSWPKKVRLLQDRRIILFDYEHNEIMGKMVIPTGTFVEVRNVFSDGALEVLDRSGQSFRILAAYTNFAEEYQKRNGLADE